MKGLELMLANMIGIKPDDMRSMFENLADAAATGVETMKRIEAQNAEILSHLKGSANGNGNGNRNS